MSAKQAATFNEKGLRMELNRARWWALTCDQRDVAFFGALGMRLPDRFDATVERACTNAKDIAWNPEFLARLVPTPKRLRYVVLHEFIHPSMQHFWRVPFDREGHIACEYEVEELLRHVADVEAPPDVVRCPDDFLGLSLEAKYLKLKERKGGGGGGKGAPDPQSGAGAPDPCGGGTPCEMGKPPAPEAPTGDGAPSPTQEPGQAPGASPAPAGAQSATGLEAPPAAPDLREQWLEAVIQQKQAQQASGRGSSPDAVDDLLTNARKRVVDWRSETADWLRDSMQGKNDWSRAARRHAWEPVIYPRRRRVLTTVVMAVDISSSMPWETVCEAVGLVVDALAELRCQGRVIYCNSRIVREDEAEPGYQPAEVPRGGGTAFEPVFERVAELIENGERIAGVAYISDMEGTYPDNPPDVPTLWLATEDHVAPFGRTVRLED